MVCTRLAWVLVLGFFLCSGCVAAKSNRLPEEPTPAKAAEPVTGEVGPPVLVRVPDCDPEQPPPATTLDALPASLAGLSCEDDPLLEEEPAPGGPSGDGGSVDQERIEHAMELLQAAGSLREQGDLDAAIEALDKAYAELLGVDKESDPELVQQKEDLRFTISKRIIEAYASRYRTSNGPHDAIPLTMNRHVQKAIDLFTGRHKDFFLQAHKRSGLYRPFILEALREADLPEELSWLPLIESGFKTRALSKANALGLWQFIASTGYRYGLKRNNWVDERMDFRKSTVAAVAYLKELHRMFGDWTTVLAAYNCGEWGVLRRIGAQKIEYLDNFWDLYERLPQETAFYVPSFLAVLHILKDPEAYGMSLPTPEQPAETETVVVSRQVGLKEIGRLIDVDGAVLADMNPALRRGLTPDGPYEVTVPAGKGERLLSRLDHVPAWKSPVPSYAVHKVRAGETLAGIAMKYRASVASIQALNGLEGDLLRSGATLKIPTKERGGAASPGTPPMQSDGLSGKVLTREVRQGDSLWKIAREYGTTTDLIVSLNQLQSANLIVGQVIRVPSWHSKSSPPETRTYIVRPGDYPYLIARRHHMDLSELLSLNKLTPRCRIHPGQQLLIRAD